MNPFFYKPDAAWAADFIPFYKDGLYRLFYLLDWRDRAGHGEGTPWYQISTADFVHFTEHGEMLDARHAGGAGPVCLHRLRDRGRGPATTSSTPATIPTYRQQGKPEQGVMHAVSDDLLHWRKLPEDTFYAPADQLRAARLARSVRVLERGSGRVLDAAGRPPEDGPVAPARLHGSVRLQGPGALAGARAALLARPVLTPTSAPTCSGWATGGTCFSPSSPSAA